VVSGPESAGRQGDELERESRVDNEVSAKQSRWFTWSPSSDTLLAVLTEIAMIALYWTTTHLLSSGWDGVLVFGVLTNLGLNVLFPVWWIAHHRKQPLSELGITTRRWLPSLLIGAALAVFSSRGLWEMVAGVDWLPHLLFNAVILWEPFFVFSWLQLRFDRAFGIVPGVLLAGLSFAAYHVGTFPPSGLIVLLISGLFFAAIFRLTSNLLTLWPLVWSVSSSMGTLMGGMQFTWNQVAIWSVILLIQLTFIGYTWQKQNKRLRPENTHSTSHHPQNVFAKSSEVRYPNSTSQHLQTRKQEAHTATERPRRDPVPMGELRITTLRSD